MRALFAGVVLLCAARAEQDSSKPADAHQTAQQPFHAPGASQVVDPRAIAVMRNLFSRPAAAFTRPDTRRHRQRPLFPAPAQAL